MALPPEITAVSVADAKGQRSVDCNAATPPAVPLKTPWDITITWRNPNPTQITYTLFLHLGGSILNFGNYPVPGGGSKTYTYKGLKKGGDAIVIVDDATAGSTLEARCPFTAQLNFDGDITSVLIGGYQPDGTFKLTPVAEGGTVDHKMHGENTRFDVDVLNNGDEASSGGEASSKYRIKVLGAGMVLAQGDKTSGNPGDTRRYSLVHPNPVPSGEYSVEVSNPTTGALYDAFKFKVNATWATGTPPPPPQGGLGVVCTEKEGHASFLPPVLADRVIFEGIACGLNHVEVTVVGLTKAVTLSVPINRAAEGSAFRHTLQLDGIMLVRGVDWKLTTGQGLKDAQATAVGKLRSLRVPAGPATLLGKVRLLLTPPER